MNKMQEFVRRHGLAVGLADMERYVERFVEEMELGLSGKESSLQMIPTYIQMGEALDYSEDVIVVDAGGTNLRVALVGFDADGVAEIKYFEKYPMLGSRGKITAEEFYDGLAKYLLPVADKAKRIGMCFSFPAEILPNRDARIIVLDKEIEIEGASGTILGEHLRAALKKAGAPSDMSLVVINDTVASQLGAMAGNTSHTVYGDYAGFILGTGLNACYTEQNSRILKNSGLRAQPGTTIVNIESGGYAHLPQSDVDRAFIAATKEPTHQLMEKMSSGAYQGGLLLAYYKAAAKEGLFSAPCAEKVMELEDLSGIDIDRFCDHPFGDNLLAGLCAGEEDAVTLYGIAEAFFDRVAMLAAVNLSAILCRLGEIAQNPCRPVCISAEGTTFYKARLLRPKLDYYMSAFAREHQLYYRFVKAENATITGTAVAGLMGNA